MLEFTLISILAICFSLWSILSGKFYRNPSIISIIGLILAMYGAGLSNSLDLMATHQLTTQIFPWLSLSSTLIGYTIAATGGSLIASGVILKIQFLHEKEVNQAMREINIAVRELEISRDMDTQLKSTASSLSNTDFKRQFIQIQERKTRSIIDLIEIRRKYRHLTPKTADDHPSHI